MTPNYTTSALKNPIKTEFTLFSARETDGEIAEGTVFHPMRKADCTLAGTVEDIESDVKLPYSRVQSTPERGSESSSGDVTTEINIDEQDDWFASVMCQKDWENGSGGVSLGDNITSQKHLTLGTERTTYAMYKHFQQTPETYQLFTGLQLNQLQLEFEVNSFVRATWSWLGADNPKREIDFTDDIPTELSEKGCSVDEAKTTKSFTTREGFISVSDDGITWTPMRQCPSFTLTINNNKDGVNALYEKKAIEQSDGNFEVTGSMDVYNADDISRELYNDAVEGKDKFIRIAMSRTIDGVETEYCFDLKVHMNAPSESQDGNRFLDTLPFTMNTADGLNIIKTKYQVGDDDENPDNDNPDGGDPDDDDPNGDDGGDNNPDDGDGGDDGGDNNPDDGDGGDDGNGNDGGDTEPDNEEP